jgi:hypothetical protein
LAGDLAVYGSQALIREDPSLVAKGLGTIREKAGSPWLANTQTGFLNTGAAEQAQNTSRLQTITLDAVSGVQVGNRPCFCMNSGAQLTTSAALSVRNRRTQTDFSLALPTAPLAID